MIGIRIEPTGSTASARTPENAVRRAYRMMCLAALCGNTRVTASFYVDGKCVRSKVTRRDLAGSTGLALAESTILRGAVASADRDRVGYSRKVRVA